MKAIISTAAAAAISNRESSKPSSQWLFNQPRFLSLVSECLASLDTDANAPSSAQLAATSMLSACDALLVEGHSDETQNASKLHMVDNNLFNGPAPLPGWLSPDSQSRHVSNNYITARFHAVLDAYGACTALEYEVLG